MSVELGSEWSNFSVDFFSRWLFWKQYSRLLRKGMAVITCTNWNPSCLYQSQSVCFFSDVHWLLVSYFDDTQLSCFLIFRLPLPQIQWCCPVRAAQRTVAVTRLMWWSTPHLAGAVTHDGLLCPGTPLLTCSPLRPQTLVVWSTWIVTLDLVQVNNAHLAVNGQIDNSMITAFTYTMTSSLSPFDTTSAHL